MAWKKGETGNAGGRPKERPFLDALRIALNEENGDQKKKRLRVIADKLVRAAEEGEAWAIKEVMDRVDGKPAQTADVNVTADHTHTHVSEPVSETAHWIEGVLRERQKGQAKKSVPH